MLYDVLVLGGGPAGYTAALYCARAALKTAVVERFSAGGQIATTKQVDNYPGFPEGIGGLDLAVNMQQQAERFGAETLLEEVTQVSLNGSVKKLTTASGKTLESKAVILATGASPRSLGLPNENSLLGKGVSYCATCDGMFYRGKEVVVVGGGDTAAADTLFLTKICKKVTMIHRRDTLRAGKFYWESLKKADNLEFCWNSTVEKIEGNPVSGVVVKNKNTGEERQIPCSGVFIAVGNLPNTGLFENECELTNGKYLSAGEDTKTNLPGIFAAGDLRKKPLRQVVTAVSDGAVAAHMAEEYLTQTQEL